MQGIRTGNISLLEACLAESSYDSNELATSGRSDWRVRIMSNGFIEACYNGHAEIVTLLLKDSRIDVNTANNDGKTGFTLACEKGHREIISLLLQDFRVNINKRDNDGYTGFIYACEKGHTEIVRLLLKDSRIDVNKANNNGWTGFIYACSDGHREIVRLLLKDSRIDVNIEDRYGKTGFIIACRNGHSEIVTLLLKDSRIGVNKADKDGKTGFIYACSWRYIKIVTLLLNNSRINVNQGDNNGSTGFMYACSNGDSETVSVLSENLRVDCVCGWKESVDRLCRTVSENVMRSRYDYEEGSLYSVWYDLTRIGMGVLIRGLYGMNERMKEVWIYGDRERREIHKRSSEMVLKRETEWRRVSDYILEEDITSVLILSHYAERIQDALIHHTDENRRVSELESMEYRDLLMY